MTIPTPSYGADQTGLISGYLITPGTPAVSVAAAEAAAWLARATEADPGFVWLHFNLAHAGAERWMRRHLALPGDFFEALHTGSRSTRIEQGEAGRLIAVMNDALYQFSFDAPEVSTLWAQVDGRALITARLHPLRSIDQLRAAVRAGDAFRSPMELLVRLFLNQADVLEQMVRDVTGRVDSIEDLTLAGRSEHKRAELGTLRRALVKLRRVLAPEPAALFRLLHRPPGWIAEADIVDLRQATEEFSAVLSDMSALQERIKLLQEEIAAQIGEQTNRSLFTLTTVTVLALPINLVAGLMGMNVGGVPLAANEHGFLIVSALAATATALAARLAFRARR
jgi:zinc transporter